MELWSSLPERLLLRKGSRLGEAEKTVIVPWLGSEERTAFVLLIDETSIVEHVVFLDDSGIESEDDRTRLRELLRMTRRRIISFFQSSDDLTLEALSPTLPTAGALAAAAATLAFLKEATRLEVPLTASLPWSKAEVEKAGLRYRVKLHERE